MILLRISTTLEVKFILKMSLFSVEISADTELHLSGAQLHHHLPHAHQSDQPQLKSGVMM